MSKILVTGAAGFIGSWVSEALAKKGHEVIGLDNFSPYYDPALKRARARRLEGALRIIEGDIADVDALDRLFREEKIEQVCHLAAQAGVRHSLENPFAYERANNQGTLSILEACRKSGVASCVYASSSSV